MRRWRGLRRDLSGGAVAQGVFTSEAAAMLAGYGMSVEHRAKTAAVFCGLWDRGLLSVSRATGGRTERHGCRLAMHWLVQPIAAAEALGDPTLAAQGLWPRFLLAWPEPSAPRVAQRLRWDMQPPIGRYWRRCTELLAEPMPDDASDSQVIVIDRDAERSSTAHSSGLSRRPNVKAASCAPSSRSRSARPSSYAA